MAGGRIRTIKPELLEDEALGNVSLAAKWLFVACILLSDDHGNLRAAPRYLMAAVFWGNPETDLKAAIAELVAAGLIITYQVKGQHFLHVLNFGKHQRIDRPGKPKVPGPVEKDESREDSASPANFPAIAENDTLDRKGIGRGEEGSARAALPEFSLSAEPVPTKKRQAMPELPAWIPPDLWEDWRAQKRALRMPMTPGAEVRQIAALERLRAEGHDPIAVINRTLERGWKSFQPLDDKARQVAPPRPTKPQRLDILAHLRTEEESDA